MSRNERGNILFLILLAVVLFAALSYAVTQSMRGGGKDAGSEKRQAQAAEILNYGASLKTAFMRMQLSGNYKFWQIDYNDPAGSTMSGTNTACTTDSCKLFNPNGGGIGGKILDPSMMGEASKCGSISNGFWHGQAWLRANTLSGVGQDMKRDLVILYPGVNRDLCIAFNKLVGVDNPNGLPPNDDEGACGVVELSGNMTAANESSIDANCLNYGDAATQIVGKPNFCTDNDLGADECYYIYMTLKEN